MAALLIGTITELAAIPKASISNNDIAYIWHNLANRYMVYNSSAVYATNTSTHPYYVRPDDYGAGPGVWVEDIVGNSPLVWSMDQVRTGSLIIADDGKICSEGKATYATSTDGFFIGYDTDAHKINIGGADSYIKWNGSTMSIKLASGETFTLDGSLDVTSGGDIILSGNDDVGDKGVIILNDDIKIGAASTNNYGGIWTETTSDSIFLIGYEPTYDGGFVVTSKLFEDVYIGAERYIYVTSINGDGTGQLTVSSNTSYGNITLNTTYDVTQVAALRSYADTDDAYISISLNAGNPLSSVVAKFEIDGVTLIDEYWLGLGSAAGRITFTEGSPDKITIEDCYFKIATSATLGQEALLIDQNDEDEPFIQFSGTSEAGASKNLSTWTTGNSIQGFIRLNANGSDVWIPAYDAPTG